MKRAFLSFLLLFPGGITLLSAQQAIICGSVKDKDSKVPIENVNVFYKGSFVATDTKGCYSIRAGTSEDVQLKFTRVGYHALLKTVLHSSFNGKDTLFVNVEMLSNVIQLKVVDIGAEKPDTVVGNNAFFIQDFEFSGKDMLLLTTDRYSDKWSVQLVSEEQKVLCKCPIPVDDVIRLYHDFLGYTNVICKEEVYRVKITDQKIILQQLPKGDFEWMILPCVDTTRNGIYYSNYRDDYPEFTYYLYHRLDSTKTFLHRVVDKDLELQYSFEYDFLKPRDKLIARKLAQENGMDKHDVAAIMTDFAHQRWFTPLYAPMFLVHDTVLIFDHYCDKLYKYDAQTKLVDSVKISYHHPEKWREWKRELVKDDVNDNIYGVFLKDGFTQLKEIDRYSGEIATISKLSFPYVDKVKVKDGYAYYIYRPFGSLQTKFLYKERISASR